MKLPFTRPREKSLRKKLRADLPLAELILWRHIKNRQINGHKFRRQFSIGRYVVDFYCPKLKVAIELDGNSHFTSEAKIAYDQKRQKFIEQYGIRFIRIQNHEILSNLAGVIDTLRHLLS